MNTEYVAWFVILVAVGVAVVAYLALGPVPEIPATETAAVEPRVPAADDAPEAEPADLPEAPAGDAAPEAQSSPVSTSEPGPAAPSGTSDTP